MKAEPTTTRNPATHVPPTHVPPSRVYSANTRPVDPGGDMVLYWMTANRRTRWNFSLDRAVDWARDLGKPLCVFEPLEVGYRWASDRLHAFAIQGMADNARRLQGTPAYYYPYVEPAPGSADGLLEALAARSCVVVADDFPTSDVQRIVAAAANRLAVRLELVDANGLLPLRAADRVFQQAHDFRRFLQRQLPAHLFEAPERDPLEGLVAPALTGLPPEIAARWPPTDVQTLAADPRELHRLPIDHTVGVVDTRGGAEAAERKLRAFLEGGLDQYASHRNDPDVDAASGLSAYLHFGHISAHHVFQAVMAHDGWSPGRLREKPSGSRSGWWGASAAVESFLDELVTWRELGFNLCWQWSDYDAYASLPAWALRTLADHERDPREHVYGLEAFENAATHDELWNAAQRQLVREGRIHNYLRMLWGKKILHWAPSPREALAIMIELNNTYALDGRNPNSYSGIFWVLGRYDRPWGPERPVFGKVRYMSSENTRRKLRLARYLAKYGEGMRGEASEAI